uniref:Cytochrome c oxidase subunit 3 n=1 Tax=Paravannella minima TaxID=1443144 RepID=A0A411K7P3_9EUKA|nr:cytochrome oxidase subunit 3 [Paravannella minima]QBC73410.1 cytochrome oxidase subunit 3 [Paravannella minima]
MDKKNWLNYSSEVNVIDLDECERNRLKKKWSWDFKPQEILGKYERHGFHLVDPSPWPFIASIGALGLTMGGVLYFHSFEKGSTVLLLGFLTIILVSYVWWRDIVREATYLGYHTKQVQKGLRYGVILFIVSEVMFFSAFFWAFFHSSLAPAVEIGSVWPPQFINVFNPWEIPFLNTLVLLLSGASITWCHYSILISNRRQTIYGFVLTVSLALFFTFLQICEYMEASFSISDGIYGSTFFMATGFHGFHVIIGTTFITICMIRAYKYHFSRLHHFGFEAAAWYWHFVDVVWLFLFMAVYWWGNSLGNIFI